MNALLNVSFTVLLYCLMTNVDCEDVLGFALIGFMCWLVAQVIINIVVVCKNGSDY